MEKAAQASKLGVVVSLCPFFFPDLDRTRLLDRGQAWNRRSSLLASMFDVRCSMFDVITSYKNDGAFGLAKRFKVADACDSAWSALPVSCSGRKQELSKQQWSDRRRRGSGFRIAVPHLPSPNV